MWQYLKTLQAPDGTRLLQDGLDENGDPQITLVLMRRNDDARRTTTRYYSFGMERYEVLNYPRGLRSTFAIRTAWYPGPYGSDLDKNFSTARRCDELLIGWESLQALVATGPNPDDLKMLRVVMIMVLNVTDAVRKNSSRHTKLYSCAGGPRRIKCNRNPCLERNRRVSLV